MAAAAAPPGAVVVPVAVAAAQPAAGAAEATRKYWTKVRLRWAQTLFVLGCAAAALAAFSINSSPTVRLPCTVPSSSRPRVQS
jgi:anti-sigma factor RsiW